jgi:RHS repeat-associated protein
MALHSKRTKFWPTILMDETSNGAYDEGINALFEFSGSSASNMTHRYLWFDQVDELIVDSQITSLSNAGNTLWALSDHLGTIRDIADYTSGTDSTAITNHRKYNAYGKLVSETNSAVDLFFGFTGKQLDEATGLQHNLFRWYDSNLGQWLSEDPLSFGAGDENVRRYVGNGHLIGLDPLGLRPPVVPPSTPAGYIPSTYIEMVGSQKGNDRYTRMRNDIMKRLKKMADGNEVAEVEAARISSAIVNTFRSNYTDLMDIINAVVSVLTFIFQASAVEKAGNFFCYEWAWAFYHAAQLESSGNHFDIKVQCSLRVDGATHYLIEIRSKATGERFC